VTSEKLIERTAITRVGGIDQGPILESGFDVASVTCRSGRPGSSPGRCGSDAHLGDVDAQRWRIVPEIGHPDE
jgi:hypothetical protein